MVVWAWVSAAVAGEERAPYTVMYERSCQCLRFTYGPEQVPGQVDVPFSDVVAVEAVSGAGEMRDIVVKTRSGTSRLAYRAPCAIAQDYGVRFANNLGMTLSGSTGCEDGMVEALERWVESVPEMTKVHTLQVALADIEARDRRDRARDDVLAGLSDQRGMLAHCFTTADAVGEGRFRLVLDGEGHPRSARAVSTVGSAAVDACVVETLIAAPDPLGTGRAWVTVGYQP